MVPGGFVEAGDEMGASGPGRPGAYPEAAGELRLSGGGKRRAFLMPDADPLDLASANRIAERIQRIPDQAEYLFDARFFERANQELRTVWDIFCLLSQWIDAT